MTDNIQTRGHTDILGQIDWEFRIYPKFWCQFGSKGLHSGHCWPGSPARPAHVWIVTTLSERRSPIQHSRGFATLFIHSSCPEVLRAQSTLASSLHVASHLKSTLACSKRMPPATIVAASALQPPLSCTASQLANTQEALCQAQTELAAMEVQLRREGRHASKPTMLPQQLFSSTVSGDGASSSGGSATASYQGPEHH